MPEYSYEAMGVTGQRSEGTLVANSEREVLSMLDARGMYPINIAEAEGKVTAKAGGRVSNSHLAVFYSQLADLLHSGVPLLRSLDILERQSASPALSAVLREVRARVADGSSLAEAMNQHTRAFGELVVSMVRAGEEGGFLEDVLRRVAHFTEHQEDLKSQVIGALAYPLFLAFVGFIVINVLVIFFVPQFDPIFKKLREKDELPGLTEAVIGLSQFMQSYWYWIIGFVVLLIFLYKRWVSTPTGRYQMDSISLRLPGAGKIFLNLALARFTRILGTMLHNGIPILHALRISKDSTGNKVLAEAIENSAENIKGGDKLATPLAACHYFPRDIVEMVAVGEESNSLEKVLIDISEGLEKRTSRQLTLFVKMLEPVMLLILAGVTGLVLAALLLPVFKMSTAMS